MIENALLQYGVLGLWTITLLVEKFNHDKHLKAVIENNTTAITKTYEVIRKCQKKN